MLIRSANSPRSRRMVLFPESCFFVFSAQKKGRKLGFQSTFQYKVIQILNAAVHRDKRQIITASTSNKRPHDDRDGPGGWRRGGEDAATGGRRRVDPVISAMQAGAGVRCGGRAARACGAGVRRGCTSVMRHGRAAHDTSATQWACLSTDSATGASTVQHQMTAADSSRGARVCGPACLWLAALYWLCDRCALSPPPPVVARPVRRSTCTCSIRGVTVIARCRRPADVRHGRRRGRAGGGAGVRPHCGAAP